MKYILPFASFVHITFVCAVCLECLDLRMRQLSESNVSQNIELFCVRLIPSSTYHVLSIVVVISRFRNYKNEFFHFCLVFRMVALTCVSARAHTSHTNGIKWFSPPTFHSLHSNASTLWCEVYLVVDSHSHCFIYDSDTQHSYNLCTAWSICFLFDSKIHRRHDQIMLQQVGSQANISIDTWVWVWLQLLCGNLRSRA